MVVVSRCLINEVGDEVLGARVICLVNLDGVLPVVRCVPDVDPGGFQTLAAPAAAGEHVEGNDRVVGSGVR